MLFIVLHGSEVVGVMSSPVDAHLIAKPLQAQVWTCRANSTDATLMTDPILPSDRPRQAVAQPAEPRFEPGGAVLSTVGSNEQS